MNLFYMPATLSRMLSTILLATFTLSFLNAQPDLMVMQDVIKNTLVYEKRNFSDQCLLNEQCIGGLGQREILRFSTEIRNIGNIDYFIGRVPNDRLAASTQFIWDECHRHWHYKAYAKYGLYDAAGRELPTSFKNGFCVEDLGSFVAGARAKYTCDNQGITAGCYDKYDLNLPCQWIDITGLAAGNYKLIVDVNWLKQKDNNGRDETNYNNNTATVCFKINRGATATVNIIDCNNLTPGNVIPPSQTGVVTVYGGNDYAGEVKTFNEGTYNATTLGVLNKNISSLLVMNGYQVRACRADGYCRTYTANTAYVGSDMDNQIVSLEVSKKVVVPTPTPTPTCNLASTVTPTDATCVSNDGRIAVATTGGTAPYQYSVDGAAFSTATSFGGLTAGAHYVTIKDNAACTTRKDFTIVKNCTPAPTPTPTPTTTFDPNKCYRLVFSHSGKVLDLAGASTTKGATLHQWTWANIANQKWKIQSVGGEYYKIISVHSGQAITILNASTADGAQLVQWTYYGDAHQMWSIKATSTGIYRFINKLSGKDIDLIGNLPQNDGAIFDQYRDTGAGDQRFKIEEVACAATVAPTPTPTPTPTACNIAFRYNWYNTGCFGNDGSIVVGTVSGASCYQYAITGRAWQNSNTFSNLVPGSYYVFVRDCHNTSCVKKSTTPAVVIKNCTTNYWGWRSGDDEPSKARVYPNPSRGEVFLEMNEHFAEQLTKIRVFDAVGKLVIETDTRSQEISFELNQNGVYLMVLYAKDGGTITRRLVIDNKEQ
jgi:Lysyl oxidase/Ricin-type beta-trefoil lectin domain-like/Secretion system C-terminal sorting domain/SprB repeat